MSSVRAINRRLWEAAAELSPGIPLQVYLVKGDRFSVWIDSGVSDMFPLLQQAMDKARVDPTDLRFILHTHPHHDHIGCDAQMRKFTGCLIAAQGRYAHWHSDFERHYQEYARAFPELIPDSPGLRSEILGRLDAEHPVDVLINREFHLDLGGLNLEAYRFSGHMAAELAWHLPEIRTMIFGDTITLLDAPFIQAHSTVKGYRNTLKQIGDLADELGIEKAYFSHYPPHSREELKTLIAKAGDYLDRLDTIILNLVIGYGEISLEALWEEVADTLEKQKDYRSLATVYAHVQELIDQEKIRAVEKHLYSPVE